MWKIVVGFIAFAAVALYVLSRGGNIDMSGEKHGVDTEHAAPAVAASAAAPAPAAAPSASASAPAASGK